MKRDRPFSIHPTAHRSWFGNLMARWVCALFGHGKPLLGRCWDCGAEMYR